MPKPEIVARFEDRTIPLPATFHDDYATRSDAARDADMRIADMYMSMDMKLFPEDYGKETGTGGSAAEFRRRTELDGELHSLSLPSKKPHGTRTTTPFARSFAKRI
jgi:hypothetical protein